MPRNALYTHTNEEGLHTALGALQGGELFTVVASDEKNKPIFVSQSTRAQCHCERGGGAANFFYLLHPRKSVFALRLLTVSLVSLTAAVKDTASYVPINSTGRKHVVTWESDQGSIIRTGMSYRYVLPGTRY